MILVIEPKGSALDMSWISDYPDEKEYLCFDHEIEIKAWILSSDYDQNYNYYHGVFTQGQRMRAPDGHLSYYQQTEIPKKLMKLKMLMDEEKSESDIDDCKITSDINESLETKQYIMDFGKDIISLDKQQKVDLSCWMFDSLIKCRYKDENVSDFDKLLNANIEHLTQQIKYFKIPANILYECMAELELKYAEEIHSEFVSKVEPICTMLQVYNYMKELLIYSFIRDVINDIDRNVIIPLDVTQTCAMFYSGVYERQSRSEINLLLFAQH